MRIFPPISQKLFGQFAGCVFHVANSVVDVALGLVELTGLKFLEGLQRSIKSQMRPSSAHSVGILIGMAMHRRASTPGSFCSPGLRSVVGIIERRGLFPQPRVTPSRPAAKGRYVSYASEQQGTATRDSPRDARR